MDPLESTFEIEPSSISNNYLGLGSQQVKNGELNIFLAWYGSEKTSLSPKIAICIGTSPSQ